jgi:hypothetical protein
MWAEIASATAGRTGRGQMEWITPRMTEISTQLGIKNSLGCQGEYF